MSRFKLYRSESVSGTKDWAIMAQSNQVQVRYGRTGSRLKLTEIPLSKCESNSPQLEMQSRIDKKLSDSSSDYRFVDEVIIDADGKLSQFTNPKLKDLIYWNLEFSTQDSDLVISTFKSTATDLKENFPNIDVVVTDNCISVNGYLVTINESGSNAIDVEQGIGSGQIGIESGVFVAVWFLYLCNKLGSKFSLAADNRQDAVGSYIEPVGFFLEEDVSRFSDFASKFNFLSPVEKIVSQLTLSKTDFDWL